MKVTKFIFILHIFLLIIAFLIFFHILFIQNIEKKDSINEIESDYQYCTDSLMNKNENLSNENDSLRCIIDSLKLSK
jgi:large-conductance mechanosensitive channel